MAYKQNTARRQTAPAPTPTPSRNASDAVDTTDKLTRYLAAIGDLTMMAGAHSMGAIDGTFCTIGEMLIDLSDELRTSIAAERAA
jgi:hypothetical protein